MTPGRSRSGLGRTALYAAALLVLVGGAVYPLRRHVEARRRALLGWTEPPGRRLARASEFAFRTAAGASYRIVPGRPDRALEDLPAEAALLVLGGFRGPYAIYLWMQVEEEKQQREHFDLIDRYHKIAALQPDYAEVWVFHMWNMAWNVSVQWQSLERKYQWIRRAIEFGEEGHRRNPRSAEIMRELGRIYLDKLGKSQEAPYYRRRIWEDEGRSTFLIAYEWYDRARTANDRYGTLTGSLGKPVVYSQACHAATDYATETTLMAYERLEEAAEATLAGRKGEAADQLAAGRARLADAIAAWEWARQEWHAHGLRWDRPSTHPSLKDVYTRFYNDAGTAVRDLEAFQARLSLEDLPRLHAAALVQDAYILFGKAVEGRRRGPGGGIFEFQRGLAALDRAIERWEAAVEFEEEGEPVAEDAAFLAALRTFRPALTYPNLDLYYGSRLLAQTRRDLEAGLALWREGEAEAARLALARGQRRLAETIEHWRAARETWFDHLRAARSAGVELPENVDLQGWIAAADLVTARLGALGADLAWERLPDLVGEMPGPPVTWPEPPVTWPNRDLHL